MSTRPEDIDRLDTLNDVALSITTTVDILNDLLSFEKLESGIMTLHKSDVHVQSFVEGTVDIFYATGRSKNVTIKIDFSANPLVPLSKPVDAIDLISIDKFKISQVIIRYDLIQLISTQRQVNITQMDTPMLMNHHHPLDYPDHHSYCLSLMIISNLLHRFRSFEISSAMH